MRKETRKMKEAKMRGKDSGQMVFLQWGEFTGGGDGARRGESLEAMERAKKKELKDFRNGSKKKSGR